MGPKAYLSMLVVLATVFVVLLPWLLVPSYLWGLRRAGGEFFAQLRRQRFSLKYAMLFIALTALATQIIRVNLPQEPLLFSLVLAGGLSITVSLLVVIVAMGIDNLRFGRGHHRRVNRLRELEERSSRSASRRRQ